MTLGLFGKERVRPHADEQDGYSRWKIASFSDEHNKKIRKAKSPFSFWSATKYVLILSILLWWLPVFGQMIAGYVGGRKAGSPWKGLAAAILPVIAIFSVMTALDMLLPRQIGGGSASASLLTGFTAAVPFIGPYLDFTREYVAQFIATLSVSSPYGMNSYVLTLAFAYIGGIFAEQSRREIEAVSGVAGSHTTVMVSPGASEEDTPPHRTPTHSSAQNAHGWRFLPIFRGGRTSRVQRFDELVAESNDDIDTEGEMPRKKTKHRRVLSKSSYPVSGGRKNPKKIKGLAGHHGTHHKNPQYRINPRSPRTFAKAEKRIDHEWDPRRRQKETAKIYSSGRSHNRGGNKGSWKTF